MSFMYTNKSFKLVEWLYPILYVWYFKVLLSINIFIALTKSLTNMKSLVYNQSPNTYIYFLFIALSINIDMTPVYGDFGF